MFEGELLCYRIGDFDDYHLVESLPEFAELLQEYRVRSIESYNEYGVAGAEFRGDNYISAYFVPQNGDVGSDPTRGLTGEEIAAINDYLTQT